MGIATWHEFKPARDGDKTQRPRKPNLDEMGPGVEAIPAAKDPHGPRSKLGRPGMRGGFKPRGRR
jgi:excinuclease ABC subunit B